jgi:MATE family multidrug resistance protein
VVLIILFIIVSILFGLFPQQLVTFYVAPTSLTPQLLYLATLFFIISIFGLFFDGIRHLISGALRGLHDSKAPMRIGILSLWLISLPLCYLVGFTFHLGPIGLRVAFITGFIVAAILLWRRMQQTIKRIAEHSLS